MPNNERMDNEGKGHGGYAGRNSGSSNYKGGKNNKPRSRGSSRSAKGRNSGGRYDEGGSSKFPLMAPEVRKAVYLTAAIPVLAIGILVTYFGGVAFGVWS